ncbi:BatA and WFA domain-containing protein [Croceitalea sp. MTPC9]|uniref:BatA domain-containing protein n=1 Tax=unclassified Croceitalea TaxID=2632280 RepID=UPI002B3E19DB|nr:BatA and WFA domain-containing protein [Croceitalea sp. MTPC6]GMN15838.1 BatA and WFA domain-containing protein [Croceitalea sp. MTPC9]
MQFKHPEILWALFLLLIPIIIHLFQLRRFKKTPFTNVAMLQKVVSESRKSNSLKKWLLLLSRLLLLAAVITAFAQPFLANSTALRDKEMVIYLDDSFSMQAKKDGFTLLEQATQELVKVIPSETKFSLFTNNTTFKDVELKDIQNNLLSIENNHKQLVFNEILLKANTLFTKNPASQKNLVLISDFQTRLEEITNDNEEEITLSLVDLKPDNFYNVAIDSIFLSKTINNQIELTTQVAGITNDGNIPISLFNDGELIAKTAVEYDQKQKASATFSLPADRAIKGRITLSDKSLTFDNDFYFNIDKKEKIKVFTISQTSADFLKRIFTPEEFEFKNTLLKDLNYSEIDNQNLVILNELSSIPTSLQTVIKSFHDKGGSLTIIPPQEVDIKSYNSLSNSILKFSYSDKNQFEQKITSITVDHPLFRDVFEKKVSNFDFPQVSTYWNCSTNAATILSFNNNSPFLVNSDNTYIFTASLNIENSNFKNSPLIVPTFYNMGTNSLKIPDLYLKIGDNSTIELPIKIEKDNVIKVVGKDVGFIPLQQSFSNKVNLTFSENPNKAGIYSIVKGSDTLKGISFNYSREESLLRYLQLEGLGVSSIENSISDLFEKLAKDNTITEYWKWFVIFVLVFALVEVLIQKFLA